MLGRIYWYNMSATLGAGGDLERITGRSAIHRIPAPTGWDRQGIGRRFFIIPKCRALSSINNWENYLHFMLKLTIN